MHSRHSADHPNQQTCQNKCIFIRFIPQSQLHFPQSHTYKYFNHTVTIVTSSSFMCNHVTDSESEYPNVVTLP